MGLDEDIKTLEQEVISLEDEADGFAEQTMYRSTGKCDGGNIEQTLREKQNKLALLQVSRFERDLSSEAPEKRNGALQSLKETYSNSDFSDVRIKAGRLLGYSALRIAVHEHPALAVVAAGAVAYGTYTLISHLSQ